MDMQKQCMNNLLENNQVKIFQYERLVSTKAYWRVSHHHYHHKFKFQISVTQRYEKKISNHKHKLHYWLLHGSMVFNRPDVSYLYVIVETILKQCA